MGGGQVEEIKEWNGERPPGFHWRDGIHFNREEDGGTWYFQYRGPGDWTYWTTLTHNGRMPDAGHR